MPGCDWECYADLHHRRNAEVILLRVVVPAFRWSFLLLCVSVAIRWLQTPHPPPHSPLTLQTMMTDRSAAKPFSGTPSCERRGGLLSEEQHNLFFGALSNALEQHRSSSHRKDESPLFDLDAMLNPDKSFSATPPPPCLSPPAAAGNTMSSTPAPNSVSLSPNLEAPAHKVDSVDGACGLEEFDDLNALFRGNEAPTASQSNNVTPNYTVESLKSSGSVSRCGNSSTDSCLSFGSHEMHTFPCPNPSQSSSSSSVPTSLFNSNIANQFQPQRQTPFSLNAFPSSTTSQFCPPYSSSHNPLVESPTRVFPASFPTQQQQQQHQPSSSSRRSTEGMATFPDWPMTSYMNAMNAAAASYPPYFHPRQHQQQQQQYQSRMTSLSSSPYSYLNHSMLAAERHFYYPATGSSTSTAAPYESTKYSPYSTYLHNNSGLSTGGGAISPLAHRRFTPASHVPSSYHHTPLQVPPRMLPPYMNSHFTASATHQQQQQQQQQPQTQASSSSSSGMPTDPINALQNMAGNVGMMSGGPSAGSQRMPTAGQSQMVGGMGMHPGAGGGGGGAPGEYSTHPQQMMGHHRPPPQSQSAYPRMMYDNQGNPASAAAVAMSNPRMMYGQTSMHQQFQMNASQVGGMSVHHPQQQSGGGGVGMRPMGQPQPGMMVQQPGGGNVGPRMTNMSVPTASPAAGSAGSVSAPMSAAAAAAATTPTAEEKEKTRAKMLELHMRFSSMLGQYLEHNREHQHHHKYTQVYRLLQSFANSDATILNNSIRYDQALRIESALASMQNNMQNIKSASTASTGNIPPSTPMPVGPPQQSAGVIGMSPSAAGVQMYDGNRRTPVAASLMPQGSSPSPHMVTPMKVASGGVPGASPASAASLGPLVPQHPATQGFNQAASHVTPQTSHTAGHPHHPSVGFTTSQPTPAQAHMPPARADSQGGSAVPPPSGYLASAAPSSGPSAAQTATAIGDKGGVGVPQQHSHPAPVAEKKDGGMQLDSSFLDFMRRIHVDKNYRRSFEVVAPKLCEEMRAFHDPTERYVPQETEASPSPATADQREDSDVEKVSENVAETEEVSVMSGQKRNFSEATKLDEIKKDSSPSAASPSSPLHKRQRLEEDVGLTEQKSKVSSAHSCTYPVSVWPEPVFLVGEGAPEPVREFPPRQIPDLPMHIQKEIAALQRQLSLSTSSNVNSMEAPSRNGGAKSPSGMLQGLQLHLECCSRPPAFEVMEEEVGSMGAIGAGGDLTECTTMEWNSSYFLTAYYSWKNQALKLPTLYIRLTDDYNPEKPELRRTQWYIDLKPNQWLDDGGDTMSSPLVASSSHLTPSDVSLLLQNWMREQSQFHVESGTSPFLQGLSQGGRPGESRNSTRPVLGSLLVAASRDSDSPFSVSARLLARALREGILREMRQHLAWLRICFPRCATLTKIVTTWHNAIVYGFGSVLGYEQLARHNYALKQDRF